MPVVLTILGMALAILLFLFLMQRLEIKSITKQLADIRKQDTNKLIHSENGSRDGANRQLINEINAMLKELRNNRINYRQKSHDLKQMMTNISHDLRTPLTSAMGYIRMIKNSKLPQEEKEREIMIIEQRLTRLEELIDSFFEFTKIIAEDNPPDMEEINLIAVLEESIAHYYDDYCNQNRRICLECDKARLNILSNRNMLMRIFDNLIGNAYKHGSGQLLISVIESDSIQLSFENELYDHSLEIEKIFDEFYTTDISRTRGNTGLGLAIAKQFTEMLKGRISAKYDGKIFSITIELWATK